MKIYSYEGKKNICGERVRARRLRLRMSQSDLAAQLQVAGVLLERDSSGQALFQTACGILHDAQRRAAMEKAMASLGIRDATERIYQTVLELCQ